MKNKNFYQKFKPSWVKFFNNIRMKFILIPFTLIFSSAFAQNLPIKKNSIYLELGGNSVFYSVNYDRLIKLTNQIKLAPRVGLMYWPINNIKDNVDYSNLRIPLELNALWAKTPKSKSFAEIGIGLSLIGMYGGYKLHFTGEVNRFTKFARVSTFRLGFRHQKPTGGFMYRAGLVVPVTQDQFSSSRVGDDLFLRLYAGFSLGYTF